MAFIIHLWRTDPKMSNYVFVLDTNKKPLEPCFPTIAKKLLKAGKAVVFSQYPFTIILKIVRTILNSVFW